jgi:hypothetical protein
MRLCGREDLSGEPFSQAGPFSGFLDLRGWLLARRDDEVGWLSRRLLGLGRRALAGELAEPPRQPSAGLLADGFDERRRGRRKPARTSGGEARRNTGFLFDTVSPSDAR